MVLETSAYGFLCKAFEVLYKNREDQLQGNPPDMLSGLELKPYFQDPQQRFLLPDFQDFWICQDVQATFYFLGRRASTSFPTGSYCTPKVQYTPQIDNYTGYWNYDHPYDGYYVDYFSYYLNADSFYYSTQAYQTMSCETDTPGMLGQLSDELQYIGSQGGDYFMYTANTKVYSTISDCMERGGIHLFADTELSGHPTSAYMPLQSPAFTEELSARLLDHKRKVFQVADKYANCFLPSQASSDVFNNGNPLEYMWCFLNESEESCATMRNYRSAFSADYVVSYEYPSNRAVPSQQVSWTNERVPGSSNPTMYRQYIYLEITNGCPGSHSAQNYRLYSQAPAFCFYGDLSADVYLMWRAYFPGEDLYYYARKMTVEFERSDYYCSGAHAYIGRYALRSKQTFSFDELFCLWTPQDVDSIPGKANWLRELAGLSAWTFPPGQFSRDDYQKWPAHTFTLYMESPFVVWKFSHPLIKEAGYHFTNQDERPEEELT